MYDNRNRVLLPPPTTTMLSSFVVIFVIFETFNNNQSVFEPKIRISVRRLRVIMLTVIRLGRGRRLTRSRTSPLFSKFSYQKFCEFDPTPSASRRREIICMMLIKIVSKLWKTP